MRVKPGVLRVLTPALIAGACPAMSSPALSQTGSGPIFAGPASPVPVTATSGFSAPRLGGYFQVRETWSEQIGLVATLNRARIGAEGVLPHRLSYSILVEYQAAPATPATPAGVSLRDAQVRWTDARLSLTAGQFKTPMSREFLMPLTDLETPDFAGVVDALAPKRDLGLQAAVTLGADASLTAGVFNGEGQNAVANRDSTVLVMGRAVVRPVPWLTLGASAGAYGSDSTRYGLEAGLDWRGASLRAEYLAQRQGSRDGDDEGWYVLLGYRVVPFLQLIVRQEDLRRPAYPPAQSRNDATTVGGNASFAGGRLRALGAYVVRTSGAARTTTRSFVGQLQVRF